MLQESTACLPIGFVKSRRITWCVHGPDWGCWERTNSTVRRFTSAMLRSTGVCGSTMRRSSTAHTASIRQRRFKNGTVDGLRFGYSTFNNMVEFVTSATSGRFLMLWVCTQIRWPFLIHLFVKRASCPHVRRRSCACTFPAVYVVMFVLFFFTFESATQLELWQKRCEIATVVAR